MFFPGLLIFFDKILRAFNGELAPAQKVMNKLKIFYINRLEESISLAVLARFNDVEFILTVANE